MSCFAHVFMYVLCISMGQIGDLLDLLRGGEGGARMFESYPVVTGREGMAFIGTVSRKDLVRVTHFIKRF